MNTNMEKNPESMNLNKFIENYKEKRGHIKSERESAEKDIINTISDAMITLNLDKEGHIDVTEEYISIQIYTDCVYILLSSLNEMIHTLQLDDERVYLEAQPDKLVLRILIDFYI